MTKPTTPEGASKEAEAFAEELRRRVKTGPDSAPLLDPALLSQAEKSFAAAKTECAIDARLEVDDLRTQLTRARRDRGDRWAEHLAAMLRRAKELEGAASSFGYPLASYIAASLQRFIAHRSDKSDRAVEEIELHVDALARIFADDLKGDGGEHGEELVETCKRWNRKTFG
jgi:hypothetical protein